MECLESASRPSVEADQLENDRNGDFTLPVTLTPGNNTFNIEAITPNPRKQINQISAYIDGSVVYGTDSARAAALRTFQGGLLKTSGADLMPLNTAGFANANDAHFFTGDGYKERIREKLLTDCNLHTIIRLPQSTFFPATVSTNLLFFQKGTPTKEIWYWEHRLPEGQKSYSKTKAIQFDEFAPLIEWWDKRKESDVAWKVKVEDLKRGFDLDVKNPNRSEEEESLGTSELLTRLQNSLSRSQELVTKLAQAIS